MENKPNSPDIKAETLERFNTFLKENSIQLVPSLSFPIYNKLPVELELALEVIKKHQPEFDVQIKVKEKATDAN